MKIRLLAVGLMSLFVVNVSASDLRDMIAENPAMFVATGYVLGTIGYKLCTTNIKRALFFDINEFSKKIRTSTSANGNEKLELRDNIFVRGYDCLGILIFESNFGYFCNYTNKTVEETLWMRDKIKEKDADILEEVEAYNKNFFPKDAFLWSWNLQSEKSLGQINESLLEGSKARYPEADYKWNEKILNNNKMTIVVDHKAIFAGLATSAAFYGLATLIAKNNEL